MHRFFVDPQSIKGHFVTLEGPTAHQITNVLRLREGVRIVVLDNSGWEIEVELDIITRDRCGGKVTRRSLAGNEPKVKVTVYQSLLKHDHFEYVLQKCTELGVTGFVPLVTARTVLGSVGEADTSRVRRWQKIVAEAAEQAGRGRLPALHSALLFASACESASGFSLIPWEGERATGVRTALRECFGPDVPANDRPFSINLFVGPEGGFAENEVDLARRYGIVPVSLGARVLRAETAAVVTTAAVLYEAGELGG
ncbi:MAG: RsmE family RNA methyltransferase [Chloroflexota bacterium]